MAALNVSRVRVASDIPSASEFKTTRLSVLANQYSQKYCSRSLSNKKPLYIFVQKHDVTEHDLCRFFVDVPSLPFFLGGWVRRLQLKPKQMSSLPLFHGVSQRRFCIKKMVQRG